MSPWPTYTLRYLLLVVFWWALALGLTREYLTAIFNSDEYRQTCFLLSAVAWGGAYGGLALRMRFGLVTGVIVAAALKTFLIWSASHDY